MPLFRQRRLKVEFTSARLIYKRRSPCRRDKHDAHRVDTDGDTGGERDVQQLAYAEGSSRKREGQSATDLVSAVRHCHQVLRVSPSAVRFCDSQWDSLPTLLTLLANEGANSP